MCSTQQDLEAVHKGPQTLRQFHCQNCHLVIQDVSSCITAALQHSCHWLTQATHRHQRSSPFLLHNTLSSTSMRSAKWWKCSITSSVRLQSGDSASLHTATKRNRMSIHTQTQMSILLDLTNIPSLPLSSLIILTKPTHPNAQEGSKLAAESDKRYSSDRIMTRYIGHL